MNIYLEFFIGIPIGIILWRLVFHSWNVVINHNGEKK